VFLPDLIFFPENRRVLGGPHSIRFDLPPMCLLCNTFSDGRKSGEIPICVGGIPDLSLIISWFLLRVTRTPGEARGLGQGLAEPAAWSGREDFRGRVGADQMPLRSHTEGMAGSLLLCGFLWSSFFGVSGG